MDFLLFGGGELKKESGSEKRSYQETEQRKYNHDAQLNNHQLADDKHTMRTDKLRIQEN